MFVLNSDITIGSFRFSGVHDVRITKSLHSIADTATIRLPSKARIVTGGKVMPSAIITGSQFNDGDPVTIRLGYNDELETEFVGFVRHRNLDMPLEVECEGYSWLLRRNSIKQFKGTITVKELLDIAVSGIDPEYKIGVQCMVDISLGNVQIDGASGFDIINNLSKYTDGCVSCFFIQPSVLWCGLLYTPYAQGSNTLNMGSVQYKLGYNVVNGNSLKECAAEDDPVEVRYSKKMRGGRKISAVSDVFSDFRSVRNKILNHAQDEAQLKQLANEKAYHLNYTGYEGSINGFLQPYAAPGYEAYIADDRYPERNGTYLIESSEVHFGMKGARRKVEIGPKSGFAKEHRDD